MSILVLTPSDPLPPWVDYQFPDETDIVQLDELLRITASDTGPIVALVREMLRCTPNLVVIVIDPFTDQTTTPHPATLISQAINQQLNVEVRIFIQD